jgi:hypothetical protein
VLPHPVIKRQCVSYHQRMSAIIISGSTAQSCKEWYFRVNKAYDVGYRGGEINTSPFYLVIGSQYKEMDLNVQIIVYGRSDITNAMFNRIGKFNIYRIKVCID